MTFIDAPMMVSMQYFTTKSHPGTAGAVVSIAIVTVVDEQVGEKVKSELVKKSASEPVTSQNLTSCVAHEVIGLDVLMALMAHFVESTLEVETEKVENIFKTRGRAAKLSPFSPSSKPSDSGLLQRREDQDDIDEQGKTKEKTCRHGHVVRAQVAHTEILFRRNRRLFQESRVCTIKRDENQTSLLSSLFWSILPEISTFRRIEHKRGPRTLMSMSRGTYTGSLNDFSRKSMVQNRTKPTQYPYWPFLRKLETHEIVLTVHGLIAMWLFPHYMNIPTPSPLPARLSTNK